MDKKDNLKKKVQSLCDTLKQNNFNVENFECIVESDPRSAFGGGICYDKKAFHFLKTNGYLEQRICWKCGDEPITNEYSFTDGFDNSIKYSICKSCFSGGKKIQNLREGKNSKNCYIATVCYGDINAPEVELLRKYRDTTLAKNIFGIAFIKFYYKFSPTIAVKIKDKTRLNNIVRSAILNPIVNVLKKKK